MVCCCKSESAKDATNPSNRTDSAHAQKLKARKHALPAAPSPEAIEGRDDESDLKAVEWIRERTAEKKTSQLSEQMTTSGLHPSETTQAPNQQTETQETKDPDEDLAEVSSDEEVEVIDFDDVIMVASGESYNMYKTETLEPIPPSRSKDSTNGESSPTSTHVLDAAMASNAQDTEGTTRYSPQPIAVEEGAADLRQDHLSDVPSDVDPEVKEKYLLACKLLKSTLVEKEQSLTILERNFLSRLLQNETSQIVPSEARIAAIETAQQTLERDVLFDTPLSPSMLEEEEVTDESQEVTEDDVLEKILKDLQETEQELDATAPPPNDVSPRRKQPQTPDGLVRFDGWNFHDSEDHYPYKILGVKNISGEQRVLTPALMEALRGFLPYAVTEQNFWLKFSLVAHGASLKSLLNRVRASSHTILGVETLEGDVFGAFCSTPWRVRSAWYGSGESFLWRLKKSRLTSEQESRQYNYDNEMEVYPYTGHDELVQYCTNRTLGVGGGDWTQASCPYEGEPTGIGFLLDGDLAGGETNSCATFSNPRLCGRTTNSNEFSIANLEVWTLTPCANERDAGQLELHKLFIEEHL